MERESEQSTGNKTFRFRSQPSSELHSLGLRLIQISDVTLIRKQQQRQRQFARLQLVGNIAHGVAHDFNNILCSIAGYASLLGHLMPVRVDS